MSPWESHNQFVWLNAKKNSLHIWFSLRFRWFLTSDMLSFSIIVALNKGFPGVTSGKEPACQCSRPRFNPWVGKIPWRGKWLSTPLFLCGESMDRETWARYSVWLQRVRHDWSNLACTQPWINAFFHKWNFSLGFVCMYGPAVDTSALIFSSKNRLWALNDLLSISREFSAKFLYLNYFLKVASSQTDSNSFPHTVYLSLTVTGLIFLSISIPCFKTRTHSLALVLKSLAVMFPIWFIFRYLHPSNVELFIFLTYLTLSYVDSCLHFGVAFVPSSVSQFYFL